MISPKIYIFRSLERSKSFYKITGSDMRKEKQASIEETFTLKFQSPFTHEIENNIMPHD